MQFLTYTLYLLIGSVGCNWTERWENITKTSLNRIPKYGFLEETQNADRLKRISLRDTFESFDKFKSLNPTISVHFGTSSLQKPGNINEAHSSKFSSHTVPKHFHVRHGFYSQRPFQFVPGYNVRMPIQHSSTQELREPIPFISPNTLQISEDINQAHDGLIFRYVYPPMLKYVKESPDQYPQRTFPFFPVHDLHKSTPFHRAHKLRKPVQLATSHDEQKLGDINDGINLHPPTSHRISRLMPKSSELSPDHHIQGPFPFFSRHGVWAPVQIGHAPELRKPVGLVAEHNLQEDPEFIKQTQRVPNHKQFHTDHKHNHANVYGQPPELVRTVDIRSSSLKEVHHVVHNRGVGIDKSRSLNEADGLWKPFNLNPIHNLHKREAMSDIPEIGAISEVFDMDSILPDQAYDVGIFRNADQNFSSVPPNNTQKSIRLNQTMDTRKNFQGESQKSDRVNSEHISQPVQLDPSSGIIKHVQHNPTSSWRRHAHLNRTHNLRKPVQLDPTHNMQKPVQVHQTHNLRKSVELEQTHDLRTPVKTDPTHSLRKPVKLMESHDLRWPVVEESDHDMRNPLIEDDVFGIGVTDGELDKVIKEYILKGSTTGFIDKEFDHLKKLLYDDEFLLSKCGLRQLNSNRSVPNNGTNHGNRTLRLTSEYKNIFRESIKACGIPYNQSTDSLNEDRKSTKWPWMVSLQHYISNRFWHKCAGSLLNNLWVITAAHCVESRPKWDFLLHLGMDDPEHNRHYVERFVDRITIHPKFNILNLDHDIALLRMDSSVHFRPNIAPICLPWKPDEIENKKAVALGWRITTERNKSTDGSSQEKTVPVLTNKECEVMFSETGSSESIPKSFLCASFQNGRQDSCIGDSGGPLAILDGNGKWLLAGLYSWGKTCTTPNQPEVYIRISRYSEWITDTITCYEDNIILL